MTQPIYRLENPVQNYAWGSTSTIPELLGSKPTGEPVAELWLGAHPAAPSRAIDAGETHSLADLIAADPVGLLGTAVAEHFGELPFLLKILAVAHPLSLQVHPTQSQARAGFAAENAAGIDIAAPTRNYRDPNHKPEQVCALTEFEGLCGFRPVPETADLLSTLNTPRLEQLRERLLDQDGLAVTVTDLLNCSVEVIGTILEELLPAAERVAQAGGRWAAEAGWVVRLDAEYPGDRGAVIAVLLNLVHLHPGEAMFLHAGELHAYLHGTAVELLANSDNVLRGGLTPKHIDVPELLKILEIQPATVVPVRGDRVVTGQRVYPSDVADFRLSRLDLLGVTALIPLAKGTPRILLCTAGLATVSPEEADAVELTAGQSVFVPAYSAVTVAGVGAEPGTVYVATPNLG